MVFYKKQLGVSLKIDKKNIGRVFRPPIFRMNILD